MNRNVKYTALVTIVLALAAGASRLVNVSTDLSTIVFWLMIVAAIVLALLALRLGGTSADDVEITTDDRGRTVANFKTKKVIAIIPPQIGKTTPRPTNAPVEPLTKLHAKYAEHPDQFTPHRIVMNLVFVDPDHPEAVRDEFEPAVTLQVRYTDEDLTRARNTLEHKAQAEQRERKEGEPTQDQILAALELGYWDGSRWIKFTPKDHGYSITKDAVASVSIKAWADRQIGAGP